MIFNNEVLFIHLGKTGGMSVASYLCQVLAPPVISVSPFFNDKTKPEGFEILVKGKRHGNFIHAKETLLKYGMKLEDFKLIFIVVRNPEDLEFSYYKHLKKPSVIKRKSKSKNGKKALFFAEKSFNDFALSPITHFDGELKDYFEIEGEKLANFKVIKFENLVEEVVTAIKPFSIKPEVEFPHKNKSKDESEKEELLPNSIENLKQKFSYFYEKGFY